MHFLIPTPSFIMIVYCCVYDEYHPYTTSYFSHFFANYTLSNIILLLYYFPDMACERRGNIFLRNFFHPSSYTFSFRCRFLSIICCASSLSSSTALSLEMFSVLKHGNEGKCFYVHADMQ
jgi:hypothetical protein